MIRLKLFLLRRGVKKRIYISLLSSLTKNMSSIWQRYFFELKKTLKILEKSI